VAEARIAVRCTPRAPRDELAGVRDGRLQARVRAAPHDGEANRALCRLIARSAGVPVARVSVVRGGRGREKLVAVRGVEQRELDRVLGLERGS
jgi:uncharacterized protein YggU (UPF0235/DUF167 family)